MEPSILSLLPPVVTIGLAIATRRILLALGIGVVLGARSMPPTVSSRVRPIGTCHRGKMAGSLTWFCR